MASCERKTLFALAVGSVLNSWSALQIAVDHGFGGTESKAKAEWMVYAIEKWFNENAELDLYEVEDFLANVLTTEFDTVIEDGSLEPIAQLICSFYTLCREGKNQEVEERIKKLPKPSVENSTKAASDEEIDGPDLSCENGVPMPLQQATESMDITESTPNQDQSVIEEMEAEKGWQIKKGKKQR